ncbi:MAG: tetratricopeptide repeat protein [Pyrinomonadaceae bacterium]|nr:tetratricopeptide repeat protein [Pyrinomonadaceae bacterium]
MKVALKTLLMMFYAPARALADVRDRAPLKEAILFALVANLVYVVCAQLPYLANLFATRGALVILGLLFQAANSLLLLALVFTPLTILFANLFERRGNFNLVLRQEYASALSVFLYALAAVSLIAIPLALFARAANLDAAFAQWYIESVAGAERELGTDSPFTAYQRLVAANPQVLMQGLLTLLTLPLLTFYFLTGTRELFRTSWWRAILIVFASAVVTVIASPLVALLSSLLASPFLILLLFFLLRGYFGELVRSQRARASFKQNLEAATLNPADASAHYNLGFIHLNRNELEEARARFNRAVEIDPEETDAHYQLGCLDRKANELTEAIKHFEQVVSNDQTHAQHEIWREIGATYLAANQFTDAHDALERFLDSRQSDPEGLYLMGRALAGMNRGREAAEFMRRCIEAVQTAPAYKRRTDARWMSEAQQFLRTLEAQSA